METKEILPGVKYVDDTAEALLGHRNYKVEHGIDAGGVFIQLHVEAADLGKVIGRKGCLAASMRTILRGIGSLGNARYTLKIVSTEGDKE